MTTTLYIYCILLGFLGIALHIFAFKAPAEKKRAEAANVPFNLLDYLKADYLPIVASVITVVVLVLLLDEIIGYNPSFIRYVKFGFLFVGYTGSSILVSALGQFGNKVIKIVDVKTDIADGK